MSDSHSNAYQKLSDMPLEHQSDFDWNRCPICFRTGVRHELESLSDLACSTHLPVTKQIIDMHGGTISIGPGTDGGVRVTLMLSAEKGG